LADAVVPGFTYPTAVSLDGSVYVLGGGTSDVLRLR
jgi:hypothetical protein